MAQKKISESEMQEQLGQFFENKRKMDELKAENVKIQEQFEAFAKEKKNESLWNGQTFTFGIFKLSYSKKVVLVVKAMDKFKKLFELKPELVDLKPKESAIKKIFTTPVLKAELLKKFGVHFEETDDRQYKIERKA